MTNRLKSVNLKIMDSETDNFEASIGRNQCEILNDLTESEK
jgi:hypothetical protein